MRTDAHVHFAALASLDPGFPERFRDSGNLAIAACHDPAELAWTLALRAEHEARGGARFLPSYGIHPQAASMELAASVEEAARSGILAAIGEAGFDFFGDRPERIRNGENERAQREAFEFQLGLATELGLPLLAHARKATDLLFEYGRALRGPPSVVFHSWSGSEAEARSLLRRGVNAFFSFGATILNGHKRAMEACRALPDGTLLAETDAPWQPPRGHAFCRFEHLDLVLDGMAALRGEPREEVEERVARAFARAYPAARKEAEPG